MSGVLFVFVLIALPLVPLAALHDEDEDHCEECGAPDDGTQTYCEECGEPWWTRSTCRSPTGNGRLNVEMKTCPKRCTCRFGPTSMKEIRCGR